MKKAMILFVLSMVIVPILFGQPFKNKYSKVIFTALENEQKMEVRLANIADRCTLKFYDPDGNELFSDQYWTGTGYAKKLDLTNLLPGNYSMKIESKDWICEQPVAIEKNTVIILEELQNWYTLPSIEIHDASILVRTSDEKAIDAQQFALFDSQGEEIFSYNLRNRNSKRDIQFDISNLEMGDYEVALYTDERTITKSLSRK